MAADNKDQQKKEGPKNPEDNISQNIFEDVQEFCMDLFTMKGDIDRTATVLSIRKNMRLRGVNAWMLIFSILLASLGLDLNSPAVIIGAMLVSPLMSPILGIGLAVGMNDSEALSVSLKNFAVSIIIAMIVSTLYFKISPLAQVTDEILGRTKPTLLDGLVAISGGFAGIISSVQKDKSNAIPGVAIATALMPPLCVSGFGLAQWDMTILFNSFYLFFLNSFFIAISTFLTVRYLKFPQRRYQNEKEKRRTIQLISLFSILIIIPSVFILFNVFEGVRKNQQLEAFIEREIETENVSVVEFLLSEGDSTDALVVNILGEPLENEKIKELDSILNSTKYHLKKPTSLRPIQAEVALQDFKRVQEKINLVEGEMSSKLRQSLLDQTAKEQTIDNLKITIDSLKETHKETPIELSQECLIAFPNIASISFGKITVPQDSFKTERDLALIDWKKNTVRKTKADDKERMQAFLKLKLSKDTVILIEN